VRVAWPGTPKFFFAMAKLATHARLLLTPYFGGDITISMASRWLPPTLDALHRRCSGEGAVGFSLIGRSETAWFLQEALLEEQTLVPPDAERINKLKALIKIVDHTG
jgi:hypothetical protein